MTDRTRSERRRRSDRPTRRHVLGGVAAATSASLAGCSAVSDLLGATPPDVSVFNRTDGSLTVTVTVTALADDEQVLSKSVDLASSKGTKFSDVFDEAGEYRFEVETDGGRSKTHEWDVPSTDHGLQIQVKSDSIAFKHLG